MYLLDTAGYYRQESQSTHWIWLSISGKMSMAYLEKESFRSNLIWRFTTKKWFVLCGCVSADGTGLNYKFQEHNKMTIKIRKKIQSGKYFKYIHKRVVYCERLTRKGLTVS